MSPLYHNVVFTGEKLFIIPYGSDVINEMYDTPAGDQMSEELAQFNYNELLFNLDSFYGLKAEHGVESFSTLVENV